MSAVFIALPVALLLAVIALAAFAWSVRSGQMDDLETPGYRVLVEEEGDGPRADGDDQHTPSAGRALGGSTATRGDQE